MKVVMVDDSPADRRLCRILLEELHGPDLEFYEESLASRALDTCRRIQPDCVLLDYKLPDMTGLEFLGRLRPQGESQPDYAVVMLTGLASEQVAVDAMKAGAQDYLVKDRITAKGLSLAVEKATQKLHLLRQLREERDRLSRSVEEKEILLKEVHHRVKNNLQVIASLLRLQAGAMANPEMLTALRDSQHRVESMALIHEQLYETPDLREVDMGRNTRQLLSNLFDAYGVDPGRICGRVEFDEEAVLGVDQAIPLTLILNELISNALKHGFPEGRSGGITVSGGLKRGMWRVRVSDDGIGMAPDASDRSRSLGLQIVRILTRQLRGELVVEPGSGGGTTFALQFPERLQEKARSAVM